MNDQQTEAEVRVQKESALFRAALPGLLPMYEGQYVVFKDGQVQSQHPTLAEAYAAGVQRFGLYGGMVVQRVEKNLARQVSPAVLHGWLR